MATIANARVGAPRAKIREWQSIDWRAAQEIVYKLQKRIAKAIKVGSYNKVKALQRILTHSCSARVLAVKRVTQNKGKNTPGVDRVIWKTPKQKMQAVEDLKSRRYKAKPLRRVYIPKKNGKLRPLGIPTHKDRAMQALHLQALDPVAETLADRNSYGFRSKRSLHDAIEQCFKILCHKTSAEWILEGDIKACFDEIGHEWLKKHIIMDKTVLKEWLNAGYMEKNVFYQMTKGCPQGGIASPTLANMALDGLEKAILATAERGQLIHFVRYADDWVVTGATKEVLEEKILPKVVEFLKERGLELSPEKTQITHIDEGFNFLGHNIRKYGGKLLTKPGKKGIKAFLSNIREEIRRMRTMKAEELIRTLNPKIEGWANHYRHAVSKKVFTYIDRSIFKSLWSWAKRRHPNKSLGWIKKRYFIRIGQRDWNFFSRQKGKVKKEELLVLKNADETHIKRHVKIKADANPYDATYKAYFQNREKRKMRTNSRTAQKLS